MTKYCNYCGNQIPDGNAYCPTCGAATDPAPAPAPAQYPQQDAYQQPAGYPQQPAGYPQQKPAATPGKGMAIASLVLGIVCFIAFGYIAGALAIIFGGVAKNKGYKGAMATAGIVCGVIGVALTLVSQLFLFSL